MTPQILRIRSTGLLRITKNHPSIEKRKETFYENNNFSFELVSQNTIFREIFSLESAKATRSNDVPTKVVKANADLIAVYLSKVYNKFIISRIFPPVLK